MNEQLDWAQIAGVAGVVCAVAAVLELLRRKVVVYRQTAIGKRNVQAGRDYISSSTIKNKE